MPLDGAKALARSIGSRFINAGSAGHINVDSGHGPWPEGEALSQELLRSPEKASQKPERIRWLQGA